MIPTSKDRRQLVFIALFAFFLFALLIAQFYRIQIIERDKWVKAAKKQHQLVVAEPFKRGLFYSNTQIKKGHPESPQPLVADVPKFHLYADPEAIPAAYRREITSKISNILRLKEEDGGRLSQQLEKKSRSRKLIMWLSRGQYEALQKWWLPFAKKNKIPRNALFFIQDYKRSYPYGKLLGQVLHALRDDKDPITHESIPTGGLELALNKYLKGKEGKRIVIRSPRHPLDTGTVVVQPQNGADVYLTINHHLQAIAEEEIAKAVQTANAKSGWAVLMHPKTGEILALAQYPWFEPAEYKKYFNNSKLEQNTKVQAITDPYEPGSTMKPITIAIALKANQELKKRGKPPIFTPEEKIQIGIGHFPGRGKPLKDTHYHKCLNLKLGLQKSSNVYMARLVQRIVEALGEKWYRQALTDIMGFGEKTGIELPAESPGHVPVFGKVHPNGKLEWSKATPYSLAMGHNILVTSMQMLRCYAIFANGGYAVQPTLIRKIVKGDQVLLDRTGGDWLKSARQVLEPEVVEEVATAMRFVTQTGGTAWRANIPGYTEAGKTGTTEKIVGGVYSKKNHISTFVGYAPANDPQIVLLIAIDEPEWKYIPGKGRNQMGGVCSAPAFSEIGRRTLHYLGVPEDDPDNKDWKDKVAQLKELYEKWNR